MILSPKVLLIILAKAPQTGRVKTRMTPPLSPDQAAALSDCLLRDALDESARAAVRLGLELVLAIHPPEASRKLAEQAPRGTRVVGQSGPDLGARMEHAVAAGMAGGAEAILLRGSDSPTLDGATIEAALAALGSADACICPDRDGGYNLLALRRVVPGLFDLPMSTSSVCAQTQAVLRDRGLSVKMLAPGFDLDTIDDLRLLADARNRNLALSCPRTLRFLDRYRIWEHVRDYTER